jgi:alanine racemase
MESLTRRAWVEIDLGALTRNASALTTRAGVPLLAVVKADAYGLGAPAVANALETLDPWGYGVATVEEGAVLRAAHITRPILLLAPLARGELADAHQLRLRPSLGTREAITEWSRWGGPWHLAIDTGMGRAGVQWNAIETLGDTVISNPPEGAFTHFHSADRDDASVREQERCFRSALAALGPRTLLRHAENSAAVERSAPSPWDLIRPGIFLYGGRGSFTGALMPEPVVHLRARVLEVRELEDGQSVSYGATWRAVGVRRVATLAAGYADGYRRCLGNRASALLHGQRVPVVGVGTMDMVMLDVTDARCAVGDVATLLGCDGHACITVDEVATLADTISYELLVGLRLRLPRVYRRAG